MVNNLYVEYIDSKHHQLISVFQINTYLSRESIPTIPLNPKKAGHILNITILQFCKGVFVWMFEGKFAILCLTEHFLLGFVVASLVFWLTQTIFSGVIGRGTYRFSLLVALSCAVVAHILEDYLLRWF